MGRQPTRPVVLVVDDEAMVRDTLHAILLEKYEVLEAADGPSAVDVVGAAPIDLVLLDLRLPGVGGLEVLPQLLKVRPGVPVVVISGVDRAETAAAAMRRGAVNYVTKPFDVAGLLEVVDEALRTGGRAQAAPARQAPWTVALIGCDASLAAALGATLMGTIHVQAHRDPPPARVLAEHGTPAVVVADTRGCRMGWLECAGLVVSRFPSTTRPVMLVDSTSFQEIRFALGDRWHALEAPFRLATLFDLVCEALPEAPARRPWRDHRTAAIIEAVASNYARFDLKRTASRLGLSPDYMPRWFRSQLGVALHSYLIRVRVHAARHMHEQDGMKIDRLASAAGFSDASHLSRRFKDVFGYRPGQRRPGASRGR